MNRAIVFAFLITAATAALPARAQSDNGTINIMRPEPGESDFRAWGVPLPKPVRRTHGSSNPVYPSRLPPPLHYVPPRSLETELPRNAAPDTPVVSPQTGRALPNPPTIGGSGPNGRETGQDRAMRCAHQAGVYGETGGSYLGACINQ